MIKLISAITLFFSFSSFPAQATQTHLDGHIDGYYTPCIYEGKARSYLDVIHFEGPQVREIISVTCTPLDRHVRGPNNSSFANSIARS